MWIERFFQVPFDTDVVGKQHTFCFVTTTSSQVRAYVYEFINFGTHEAILNVPMTKHTRPS